MKLNILFLLFFFGCYCKNSRAGDTDSSLQYAMYVMQKVKQTYTNSHLTFDVKYTCANEHTPATLLDSMSGNTTLHGNNYYSVLGGTISVRNDRYTILLFEEDKLMYLARSSADTAGNMPVQLMLELMKRSGIEQCTVRRQAGETLLQFSFAAGRTVEMAVDTTNWYVTALRMKVKTALLMGNSRSSTEGYDEYMIVEARFLNYSPATGSADFFDEKHYFRKEGQEFMPATAYAGYTIFIGTPDLQ